jgi:hypothetical protein
MRAPSIPRRIGALTIALTAVVACLIGSTADAHGGKHAAAAGSSAHERSTIPKRGDYTGADHQNLPVTLKFDGTEVKSFYVGQLSFGNAHVGSNDFWDERCNNGVCFSGRWVSPTDVVGKWRRGGDRTYHVWSARTPSGPSYFQGTWRGFDHHGNNMHLRWNGTHVSGFTVNGFGDFPSTTVDNTGHWNEVCSRDWCYKGHFISDDEVVGEWRTPGSTWYAWEVYPSS